MPRQKHYEISAVHERNLEELLESLGLRRDVEDGMIRCKFCDKKISLQNLQCLYPKNNEIVFCCDDVRCFEQALKDSSRENEDV